MTIPNKVLRNILGTPKKRGGKTDWDFDGVPNKKDCQPRNVMRQDAIFNVSGMAHNEAKMKIGIKNAGGKILAKTYGRGHGNETVDIKVSGNEDLVNREISKLFSDGYADWAISTY